MLIFSCNSIRTYIEILRKFRLKMAWILPVIEKEQNGRKTSAVHTFCNKSMIQTIIMSWTAYILIFIKIGLQVLKIIGGKVWCPKVIFRCPLTYRWFIRFDIKLYQYTREYRRHLYFKFHGNWNKNGEVIN